MTPCQSSHTQYWKIAGKVQSCIETQFFLKIPWCTMQIRIRTIILMYQDSVIVLNVVRINLICCCSHYVCFHRNNRILRNQYCSDTASVQSILRLSTGRAVGQRAVFCVSRPLAWPAATCGDLEGASAVRRRLALPTRATPAQQGLEQGSAFARSLRQTDRQIDRQTDF